MKPILTSLILTIISVFCFGQGTTIVYSYDQNGNRIARTNVADLPLGATLYNPISAGTFTNGGAYTGIAVSNLTANNYGNDLISPTNQPSDDVFYTFSLNGASVVQISLCNSALEDTYVHLLHSSGMEITSNDNSCGQRSKIIQPLSAGMYFIVMEGKGSNAGNLTLNLNVMPFGAIKDYPLEMGDVTNRTYSTTVSNVSSNYYGNDYSGTDNQTSEDVFYRFKLTASNTVTISTCGSNFDTYLHLLDASGNLIAGNDDCNNAAICSSNTASYITKSLPAGTYYIVAEGYSSNSGNIVLNLSASMTKGKLIAAKTETDKLQTEITLNNENTVKIFPNPATDIAHILSSSAHIEQIEVYSIKGNLMCKITGVGQINYKLDISEFEAGLYLVKIVTASETKVLRLEKIN
jgi:hypothetical protein